MISNDIKLILAKNLRWAMTRKFGRVNQSELARLSSDLKQTTISYYLNPDRREATVTGKDTSPTLVRVVALAMALDVDPWMLLHPNLERALSERDMYSQFEKNYKTLPKLNISEKTP